jgi:hypothetical protein
MYLGEVLACRTLMKGQSIDCRDVCKLIRHIMLCCWIESQLFRASCHFGFSYLLLFVRDPRVMAGELSVGH